jgi:rRNA maturation protein Nop10
MVREFKNIDSFELSPRLGKGSRNASPPRFAPTDVNEKFTLEV